MNEINNRLFQLRKALGLNQEEFGKKICIVKSGISNMENGIREVQERTIKLICQEFNVNEHWLRTGEGNMFNTFNNSFEELIMANLGQLDELDRKIITEYIRLQPSHREVIKEYIRKLI